MPYKFTKIVRNQTDRVSSSTLLRSAVKDGDKFLFYEMAGMEEDTIITINNIRYKFFDIMEEFII